MSKAKHYEIQRNNKIHMYIFPTDILNVNHIYQD